MYIPCPQSIGAEEDRCLTLEIKILSGIFFLRLHKKIMKNIQHVFMFHQYQHLHSCITEVRTGPGQCPKHFTSIGSFTPY